MKPFIAAIGLALALAISGCSTLGANTQTAAQASEGVETGAELLYYAIGKGVDLYKTLPNTSAAQATAAQNVKVQAWADLGKIRQLYAAGQSITGAVAALAADQKAAVSLGVTVNTTVTAP